MDQNWLSAAGVAIDLAGFLVLLREWWLAFFHETTTAALAQRRAWERSVRHHHHTHASDQLRGHLETAARIQDEMAQRNDHNLHMATLQSRKRMFVLATVLILVGGLMQLAGTIPVKLF
ncbi:hypothetical protein [Hyphomicrobium sp.]|uniref:hypothetical protein n=1 Tax=Hyphomicrobium sp. TaxID=82 RepID=UPI0025BF66BD|nr:hypothetical protein [Hyphomicrobium sp.]MCC7253763.1 hypothetical protein [Hyphomicrobium sp.]